MARIPHDHTPSDTARRRAEAAGLDLDTLRREDPERYKMLNAEEAIRADGELAGPVAQTLSVLLPGADIFRLEAGAQARFLVFPSLAEQDVDRLEDAAARLVSATSVPHAMFRVVADLRGERREVLVAVPPDGWRGDERVVGPFDTQGAAEAWADRQVAPPLVADAFAQEGAWYVDVFSGEEDMVRARS